MSDSPGQELLEAVAAELAVDPSFIEKDWHTTQTCASALPAGGGEVRNRAWHCRARAGVAPSLTKRLVNHAWPNDFTEGYAADWTIAQLRGTAQKIADRIEVLIGEPQAQ